MIINKYENEQEWLDARRRKITGTRLKDIVVKRGTERKLAFYELIAERLALPREEGENPMERGKTLETEAIEKFTEETGKKVNTDLVLLTRDDDENIAISPDGYIGEKEAVEVKCLSSARHVEALITEKIPKDYEYQVLQYFIVNDKLEKLYFCFYDPSLTTKQFFYIEVDRKDKEAEIEEYLEYERKVLEDVNELVNKLSF